MATGLKNIVRISDLKKNEQFRFNDYLYTVTRKYTNDDKPLIAYNEDRLMYENFYYEGLEVDKVS